jgi:NAD(P)-dependent dehydrogenase (short-subunit alcohol dehydrogenase family)
MKDLQGRIALVTGASQGIGRACALELARAGATVVLAARNEVKLAEAVEEIQGAGGEAAAIPLDLASEESIKSVAKSLVESYGKIEILVNNAGITRDGLMLRMKREDWDDVLRTNLTGAFLLTQALLSPMLKNRWGRTDRADPLDGARAGLAGDYRECRGARVHRDADDRRAGRKAARGHDRRHSAGPAGDRPGNCAGSQIPGLGRGSLHHRPRAGCKRRNVHGVGLEPQYYGKLCTPGILSSLRYNLPI